MLVALIIFVIVLIAECSIIYGSVSSALTAFGRNPLAKKTIRSEMLRIIFVALGVLIIGMISVLAVLWI